MKRKEDVSIGTELKKILDQTGMTSYRLSQELGIGQSYLSRLFNNKFNPSYGLVKRIAEKLGYNLRLVKTHEGKRLKKEAHYWVASTRGAGETRKMEK